MKCILDALLVLTKQDRLCHVITATSDSFFMQWLRQFNVLQHCSILTVGDCDKEEARNYFDEELRQEVPEELRTRLDFEELFEVFGGKLAHLQAFVADFGPLSSSSTLPFPTAD